MVVKIKFNWTYLFMCMVFQNLMRNYYVNSAGHTDHMEASVVYPL